MSNETELQLISLMQNNPDLAKRLERLKAEIRNDKGKLNDVASQYNAEYKDEIAAGTALKSKLLTEGYAKGLTKDKILSQHGKFVPCLSTPILNFLYFLIREEDGNGVNSRLNEQRNRENFQNGHLFEEIIHENIKETPEMIEYIYAGVDLPTFNKIKKLKALTMSPNIEESTAAFKKCRELCEEFKLEYDKIPIYVGKK